MATQTAIGFSSENDPVTAFKNAAVMAKNQTPLSHIDLAFVFATPTYAPVIDNNESPGMDLLRKILQPKQIIGITAPALILSDGTKDKGVSVLLIESDEIDFTSLIQEGIHVLPLQETGINFARDLTSKLHSKERHGALVFCSTIALNHSLLIRGLRERLGSAFAITGAINPGTMFGTDRNYTNALGGIIFGGQLSFTSSLRHGWQPLGKPRVITDSDSNLIRQIDNKPAVSIYQTYLPDHFSGASAEDLGNIGLLYPLGLSTARPKEYVIKNPTAVLSDGSIVCQGEISPGTQVHLMIADKDACRKAAHDSAVDIRDRLHGKHPKLILIFASIARKKLFGRAAWQEIEQIKEILGLSVPVFGMYTYGEIGTTCPPGHKGLMDIQTHNASILITALG